MEALEAALEAVLAAVSTIEDGGSDLSLKEAMVLGSAVGNLSKVVPHALSEVRKVKAARISAVSVEGTIPVAYTKE